MIARVNAILLILASAIFLAATPTAAQVFDAKETVLDNGMRVVVVENSRAPVVTHMVWYKVGAMDEPRGKSGIAHVLEHLMFKGTENLEAGEFSRIVARNGGRDNAFTSQDYTAYFQSVASDRLALVMELEADRMANLAIDPAHFGPELQVVLEERNQRVENEPSSILWEQSASALYRNHPYATPIIGWRHELESLTQADAEAFYERFYTPSNAILIVSGDVTAEEVFALAETHYGAIPDAGPVDHVELAEPPLRAQARVTYRDARVQQPSLTIRRLAPSWATAEDKTRVDALTVLSEILGGGRTSRLYQALVVDAGIAVSAGSWYQGDQRGPGVFGLYISPAPDSSLGAAEAALRGEIQRLLENGVSDEEVARARIRLQDAAATARDSLMGPAMSLGRSLMAGYTVEEVERWPERIGAVTTEQVNAAAEALFADPGEVVARLLSDETNDTPAEATQ